MTNRPSNVFVSTELKDKRYEICKKCEHFIKTFKGCKKCGCLIPAKIQFTVNTCPINNW